MSTNSASVSHPSAAYWSGVIVTVLLVSFLAFDAVGKIIKVKPVVEGSAKLGLPPEMLVGIGFVLLACTALYSVPKTAMLGAILLTGYLGGATAIHVRAGSGAFPVSFSVVFGILVWGGLVLRDPRLLWTILLRQ